LTTYKKVVAPPVECTWKH